MKIFPSPRLSSKLQTLHRRWFPLFLPVAVVNLLLAGSILPAQADRIRECRDYGVVRDRSDHEVPLLPRNSIAACARSYQTLYQTYRVRRTPDAATQTDQAQTEASTGSRPNLELPESQATDRSNHESEI